MRTRRSHGIIERYGVTLSPGLAAERKIIDELLACPKGRRQQWLRKLLTMGIRNRHLGQTAVEKWTVPEGAPVPNKLLSIQLDRRAPEDAAILALLETLPLVRRSQALRSMMVTGISSPDAEAALRPDVDSKAKIEKVEASRSENEHALPSQEARAKTIPCEKVRPKPKTSSIKSENEPVLVKPVEKIGDNPHAVVVLDEGAEQIEAQVQQNQNPPSYSDNEVEDLPATETVISGLQSSGPALDFDLSEIEGQALVPTGVAPRPDLSKMRSLFK